MYLDLFNVWNTFPRKCRIKFLGLRFRFEENKGLNACTRKIFEFHCLKSFKEESFIQRFLSIVLSTWDFIHSYTPDRFPIWILHSILGPFTKIFEISSRLERRRINIFCISTTNRNNFDNWKVQNLYYFRLKIDSPRKVHSEIVFNPRLGQVGGRAWQVAGEPPQIASAWISEVAVGLGREALQLGVAGIGSLGGDGRRETSLPLDTGTSLRRSAELRRRRAKFIRLLFGKLILASRREGVCFIQTRPSYGLSRTHYVLPLCPEDSPLE